MLFVPQKWVQILVEVLQECNNLFSSFVIGKAIDSLIIGILCFILMNIFRLPYAVLISVIVGITNMIPYFGPLYRCHSRYFDSAYRKPHQSTSIPDFDSVPAAV